MGFPKTRSTVLGVRIVGIIVLGGLYWGTLTSGNYHMLFRVDKFIGSFGYRSTSKWISDSDLGVRLIITTGLLMWLKQ